MQFVGPYYDSSTIYHGLYSTSGLRNKTTGSKFWMAMNSPFWLAHHRSRRRPIGLNNPDHTEWIPLSLFGYLEVSLCMSLIESLEKEGKCRDYLLFETQTAHLPTPCTTLAPCMCRHLTLFLYNHTALLALVTVRYDRYEIGRLS